MISMDIVSIASEKGEYTMIAADLHTHTIASGHGSAATVGQMARVASMRGLRLLGISDHGPATPGAALPSYFYNLVLAPRDRFGIRLLYGVEANILDGGSLDLDHSILARLDYVIASMHCPPRSVIYHGNDEIEAYRERNTRDYIRAMSNPLVRIIGHPDNSQFPYCVHRLTDAAAESGVILEINEASLGLNGFHRVEGIDTEKNYRILIRLCKKKGIPLLVSSDSHGPDQIGQTDRALALLHEQDFPRELLVNEHFELLHLPERLLHSCRPAPSAPDTDALPPA